MLGLPENNGLFGDGGRDDGVRVDITLGREEGFFGEVWTGADLSEGFSIVGVGALSS